MLIPKFVPKNLDAQIAEMNASTPGAARKRAATVRESAIERQLVKRVKELGGEVRKVKWIGRAGAPDRIVMLPPAGPTVEQLARWFGVSHEVAEEAIGAAPPVPGRTIWVELKAPGKKPTAAQAREHERMRKMGQRVEVVDSFERIEKILS